jgi:hypothetical protein
MPTCLVLYGEVSRVFPKVQSDVNVNEEEQEEDTPLCKLGSYKAAAHISRDERDDRCGERRRIRCAGVTYIYTVYIYFHDTLLSSHPSTHAGARNWSSIILFRHTDNPGKWKRNVRFSGAGR